MKEKHSVTYNTSTFGVPWLLIFLVIKLGGTSLAAWSWWWIFFPIVPVLVVACKALGLL